MTADRVQFRTGPLAAQLAQRGGDDPATASQIAQRDLGRYYDLLRMALPAANLTEAEAAYLVDAYNGTLNTNIEIDAQMITAQVAGAAEDGLGEKWGVDHVAFRARIANWTLATRVAVLDAIERFWEAPASEQIADRLAAVGLIARG